MPPLIIRIVDIFQQVSQSIQMMTININFFQCLNFYLQAGPFSFQAIINQPGFIEAHMAGVMNNDAGQPNQG